MSSTFDPIPFALHLGLVLESSGGGRCRCTLPLRPEHLNSNGVGHGGLTFTLADTCMGAALKSVLEAGEWCATVETKINYFLPAVGTSLRCESQVVHRGRSLASVEGRVWAGDTLVATASGTFAIRRAPAAAAAAADGE